MAIFSTQTAAIGSTVSGALWPISVPAAAQAEDDMAATVPITITPLGLSFDAAWLSTVEQRIKASVAPEGFPDENNGAWLQSNVGSAAVDFFRSTSAALPSEPYIYSSRAGDLVAEFIAPRGKMTCIVAPNVVYVFAVAGDDTVEKKFVASEIIELRSHLQNMTNLLRPPRQNGTLGSR